MSTQTITLKHFRLPQLAIGRFIARRNFKTAAIWALIFGAFVAGKAAGYASAYPTEQSRETIVNTLANNVGLAALLGSPHKVDTVAGFTVWNTLNVMMIIGAIWAFLLASRVLRGDEQSGRWELLLSGQATARRATLNTLGGLAAAVGVLYVIAAAAFGLAGRYHTVNFGPRAALFFALAAVCGAVMFVAVGALASQLMATRSRAAGLSAAVFVIFFVVRAVADTTTLHWLLDVSPLGWIEKLQPLYASRPVWLAPIGLFSLVVASAAVWLAGRRDLGQSVLADPQTAKPRYKLLHSALGLAWRQNRAISIGWLAGISWLALFFGFLTKSAVQAFSQSHAASQVFERVAKNSQALNARSFLGVIFFLLMPVLMAGVASAVSRMREDEADGLLDNLLVRKIGRYRWYFGRVLLIIGVIIAGGLLAGAGTWAGTGIEHLGVSVKDLFKAGANLMVPGFFELGAAALVMAVRPRLSTTIAYALIGWSFLLQILSSGLNLSHWFLDTSVLYHMALAPGVEPNWHTNVVMVTISMVMILAAALIFSRRDLQNE